MPIPEIDQASASSPSSRSRSRPSSARRTRPARPASARWPEIAELQEQARAKRASGCARRSSSGSASVKPRSRRLRTTSSGHAQGRSRGAAEHPVRQDPRAGEGARRGAAKLAQAGEAGYLKEEVTDEDIAAVIAKWTGIPVSKMLESEQQKLLRLEEELGKRVVGQREAVVAVANAVRRARAGSATIGAPSARSCSSARRAWARPSWRKALAEFLFDDERAMIRIDMSEYMEKHAVSRLIGAPPGLRRLRRGRPAHRARAPPALLGAPLRRDREGPPRRLERAAPGARRRPPHRRPGPHGGLQEHGLILTSQRRPTSARATWSA
jgi:ATP-dependent Clp protease ATP-binding subunit ClpA